MFNYLARFYLFCYGIVLYGGDVCNDMRLLCENSLPGNASKLKFVNPCSIFIFINILLLMGQDLLCVYHNICICEMLYVFHE